MISMKKMVWVRADLAEDFESRKDIVRTSLESDITDIVVLKDELDRLEKLGRFNPISIDNGKVRNNGSKGTLLKIESKEDQKRILDDRDSNDLIVVSAKNWKVIPMENLIAGFQGSGTKLLAEVSDAVEAALFLETLEVGVDGVVLRPNDPNEVLKIASVIDGMENEHFELHEAKITEMRPVGTGDRVCIDTCSILNVGEGMLVGSQSSGMFFIHSESVEGEYVDTRPFRVNAGSIHSYVLIPGDRTRYLSDLKVGDRIIVLDQDGKTRAVTIGRLKIERRPLLLIKAESGEGVYNIILQNAETVRLISNGKPVSIVELKVGDKVILKNGRGGRHFGMKVEETIIEK